jgi:hypothetical protein
MYVCMYVLTPICLPQQVFTLPQSIYALQVSLASGSQIECDHYVPAFSEGPNTDFVPPASLDEKGFIKVNSQFMVEGFRNVLCFGDW